MVNADMCKHDWPGSSCPDCRREGEQARVKMSTFPVAEYVPAGREPVIPMINPDTGKPYPATSMAAAIPPPTVPPNSIWEYKEKYYRVEITLENHLSQDHEIDEWGPTVKYRTEKDYGTDLVFYRTVTEFLRKFRRVS